MSNTSPTFSAEASPVAGGFSLGAHPGTADSRAATRRPPGTTRSRWRIQWRIGLSIGGTDRGGLHPATQLPAAAAARLVEVRASHHHPAAFGDLAIGAVGRLAAHDTDGERLGDELRDREQLRHRLERLALVVLVEPRDDHPLAAARQLLDHR